MTEFAVTSVRAPSLSPENTGFGWCRKARVFDRSILGRHGYICLLTAVLETIVDGQQVGSPVDLQLSHHACDSCDIRLRIDIVRFERRGIFVIGVSWSFWVDKA